jgi:hypothetical protein
MNMQTGFGGDDSAMVDQYVKSMVDIMTPVMERSMILAAEYSKACGRDILLPEDVEYAMKYCAMYTVGQTIGSIMPEMYDEEMSDDDEEEDEENLPEFVRYSGDDETFNQMNQAYDRWDSWEPQSPIEEMLKNAINSNEHLNP